jgi:large subunit ribosomal protein L3
MPGRKMAGHMGQERKTIQNLEVVSIDKENNILAVKGAVPGMKGTMLEIFK